MNFLFLNAENYELYNRVNTFSTYWPIVRCDCTCQLNSRQLKKG